MSDTEQSSRRQFILGSAAIFGGAVLLPGCGGGGDDSFTPGQASTSRGVLGSRQVVYVGGFGQMYPVSSAGKGTVRVDINADQTQMNVTLSTSGLSGVNFVAINAGRAGEAGPVPVCHTSLRENPVRKVL